MQYKVLNNTNWFSIGSNYQAQSHNTAAQNYQPDFYGGQIINGTEKAVKYIFEGIWRSPNVIEVGTNKYLRKDSVSPIGNHVISSSAEGDTSSAAANIGNAKSKLSFPSIATIKDTIMSIASDKAVVHGAGAGAAVGLLVAILVGANKLGTALAGAVVGGWSARSVGSNVETKSSAEGKSGGAIVGGAVGARCRGCSTGLGES